MPHYEIFGIACVFEEEYIIERLSKLPMLTPRTLKNKKI
jgi:hypothetical protein